MNLLEIIESKMSLLGEKWGNITKISISYISLAEASLPESRNYSIDEFKKIVNSGRKIAFYLYCENFIIYKDRNINPEPTKPEQLFHLRW